MTIDLVEEYQTLRHAVNMKKLQLKELIDTDTGGVYRAKSIHDRTEELASRTTKFDAFKVAFADDLEVINDKVAERFIDYQYVYLDEE